MSELPSDSQPGWPPPPPPPPEPPPYIPAGPTPAPRRQTNLVGLIAGATAALLVLVLGGIYAVVGSTVASGRNAAARSALDSALGHQVDFGKSIASLNDGFGAFSASAFDPQQYKATVDSFVKSSQAQSTSVADDDKQLEAAARKLGDTPWLTVFSRGDLDRAAGRIAHARMALVAGRTITSDYIEDGKFLEAYATVLIDIGNLGSAGTSDIAAATTIVNQLKTHVDTALGLARAPGLPDEVRQLMVDLQSVASDFQAVLGAVASGDHAAYDAAKAKGDQDVAALNGLQTSGIGDEVSSFYQPYFDTYQSELKLASA